MDASRSLALLRDVIDRGEKLKYHTFGHVGYQSVPPTRLAIRGDRSARLP